MSPFIAFLASNKDPVRYGEDAGFVYRCASLSGALEALGNTVAVWHWSGWRAVGVPDLLVVHRPRASLRLRLLLRWMRRRGVRVLADVDDLIFDEGLADGSPGVLNGIVPVRRARALFRKHRKALGWFDEITVSTEPLAEHARRLFPGKAVHVIPNAVHWAWHRAGLDVVPVAEREKVITYFPGTRSHDRDFALIREPLSRFLRAHPEVKLRITGRLDFAVDAHPGQVQHEDRVPFAEYMSRVRAGWVNLAPLEDTPFNRCKSALKVIEAGYWGIPTVCSPNPDMARFSEAGAWIAETSEQWVSYLERLLDDAVYRQATEGLRERTLALADVEVQAKRLLELAERS